MADTKEVISDVGLGAKMLEQLGKAFVELQSYKESSLQKDIQWEDIQEYFITLERSFEVKLEDLKAKEQTLKKKQSETRTMIEEREAVVLAKEHASWDRLQELRDTAVSAIAEARQKYKATNPEPVIISGSKEKQVSDSLKDPNAENSASEAKRPNDALSELPEAVSVETQLHSHLKQLCEQMDAKGLIKYILENRKNLLVLCNELSLALKYATDPARLVLNSLEGFYPLDQSSLLGNEDTALQGLRRSCLLMMESAAPLLVMTEPGVDHPISSEIKQQAKAIADVWKPKLAGLNVDASNGYSLESQAFLQLLATFGIAQEFDEDELCKLVIAVSRRRQAPELCRSLGLTHKMSGVVEDLISRGRNIDAVHFLHAFQLTESFPPVPLLKAYLTGLKDTQENNGDTGSSLAQKDPLAKELGALKAVIKCIEEYKLQQDYSLEPLQKRVAELEKAKFEKKRSADGAKNQSKRPREGGGYGPHRHAAAVDNWQLPTQAFNERRPYAGGVGRYAYNMPPTYDAPLPSSFGQYANDQRTYHYPDGRAQRPSDYGTAYGQHVSDQRKYHYPDGRVQPPADYGVAYGQHTNDQRTSHYPDGKSPPFSQYATTSEYGTYIGTGLPSSSNYGGYARDVLPSASSTYGSYKGTHLPSSHQPYM